MINYYALIQQLYQVIGGQNQQILSLKKEIQLLKEEFQSFKTKTPVHVDRIEYKFDQLKVETLEGTLNIGMNPSDLGDIADTNISTPQPIGHDMAQDEMIQTIRDKMNEYMEKELPHIIQKNEAQLNRSLTPQYYDLIKEDLTKQLPERIQFYVRQFSKEGPNKKKETQEQTIINHVKQDIQQAIFHFMSKLPN
ncbi:spore germination protein PC [Oikeobacillus pervagus]|uniref:Spore germination protein PC n=1 Tax=Oikeobacillus pervagus TaxID=1325931 RepID=A0AAJ1WIU8_9BACI|nr:spore germination protein GerPC [Oikeobacillus pervagus]MDQ0214788.1 spore germination protein PC [Oikeobacillus pervagus]